MITKNPTSRTLIVHPVGNLDALQADHYRRQVRMLIEEGYRFLIFDLADTTYINSSGLGLLVELFNTVGKLEGSLKLINCTPHAIWLLEQTRLDSLFLRPAGSDRAPAPVEAQFDPLHALMCDEILLLAQIHEVAEQVLGLDDPVAAGQAILQGVIKAMRAERGAIFLLDPSQTRLRLAHWQGRDKGDLPPELDEITLEPGHFETKILDQNEVTWHKLVQRDEFNESFIYHLGFETLLAAPIRGRLRCYGLLIVEAGEETGRFVQAAKPLIRTFTDLYGLAFEKILLIQRLNAHDEQFNRLMEQARQYHQSLASSGRLATLGAVISGLSSLINDEMVPLFGYTQMLTQRTDLPEWVADKISKIHHSSSEMRQVIEKLVRVSHMGDHLPRPMDLRQTVRTAVDLLDHHLTQGRIALDLDLPPEPVLLLGDADLLLQATLTVLHRACASFAEGAEERWIRVALTQLGGEARLLVEDSGSGFTEDDLESRLDPLVPLDAMSSGALFNYTISRNVIQRHGGRLILESRPAGGKRVMAILPVGAEGAQPLGGAIRPIFEQE